MPADEIIDSAKQTSLSTLGIIKQGMLVIKAHPQLLAYPYLASLVIFFSSPIISGSFIAHWYNRIFVESGTVVAPHRVSIIVGIVTFSAFYIAFISAYFTTAVSAAVIATLDGQKPSTFFGLREVFKHFFRVSKFALLSILLFPMGIYAQRRKLPRGIIGILGSSITLHMAQIAPAILYGKSRYGETIRDSVDKLGRFWREGLALRIITLTLIFAVFVAPKLIQHTWYKSQTASNVGWIVSLMIGASGYAFFKVLNAIFTSVMYYKANDNRANS